ncbi:hypothetical protein AB4Z50_35625 [Paenibacillus sp. 2TAB26]|uniref:hypothetical protein n=1 Tax=Paenibacillus sp. 2TAB26 TaxID=3233005 RepID=UPI003F9AC40F
MFMEWIDHKLEQRSWEVLKVCEEENEGLSKRFNDILSELKKVTPESAHNSLYALEEICAQKSLVIMQAYRIGFSDAMKLKSTVLD